MDVNGKAADKKVCQCKNIDCRVHPHRDQCDNKADDEGGNHLCPECHDAAIDRVRGT
jgi:hypothetical protein